MTGITAILVTFLIVAAVVWFAFWLIDSIPLPHPINWIAKAIVAVIALSKILTLI